MHPSPYGGLHVLTSMPTPATSLIATLSFLPPLGTSTIVPRSPDAPQDVDIVSGSLLSIPPTCPTVMLNPCRSPHGTSVEATTIISVGVRQLAKSAAHAKIAGGPWRTRSF
jgi:hypothetical protein